MASEEASASKYFDAEKEQDTDCAPDLADPVSPIIPTNKSKLNLADYAFSPKPLIKSEAASSESPRRSPRTPRPIASSPITPSPLTPSPLLKRKSSSLLASVSPSLSKKSRSPSGYAPPEVYAHLPYLVDVIEPNLICLFVGLNPGVRTAQTGHAYSHPSNLFWKLLHKSGCTTRLCRPEEDRELPRLFALGNTNIVERPSKNGAELSKAEMDAGVVILEEKIRKYRPEAVAIVGKSIWESVWRVKHGKPIKKEEFKYGFQDDTENMGIIATGEEEAWKGARVFVASSTSGLAATLLPAEKERIWKELGVWVEQRREERAKEVQAAEQTKTPKEEEQLL